MRIPSGFFALTFGLLAAAESSGALAAGDPVAGKAAFADQCSSCHTIDPKTNGFGPSLSGVVGRHAGAVADFAYSQAMASSKLVWQPADIDAFLTSTTGKVPGTSMPVAIPDAALRANIIAYLSTLKTLPPLKKGDAAPTALKLGPTDAELANAAKDTKSWLYASKDYSGQRYVELKQITPANAAQLRPACLYRSATAGSTQTNLLVYEGVMYFTIDETTVAIDAATCREKWTYTWEIKGRALSKANRGVAIKDGRVVRGTPDGFLIALNMADGSLIWEQKIADAGSSQYLSMPPLIYQDMVIYGPAGADWGAKNWIAAYKLDTGEQIWRFNEVPDATEGGADSWKDAQAREHGGGSLWTPLSFDEKAGIVYVPVGNPAPDFDKDVRGGGGDLYTDSAVALDVKTGRLLWFHQFVPDDDHDRDLSQVSPLFDATIGGKKRKLISVAGKDGLLRVLDRDSHDQLYEVEITSRTDWDKSPTVEGVHSCPGLLGGLEWNGPAYSRASNTLFVSTVDWCGTFRKGAEPAKFTQFSHYYNGAVTPDPRDQSRGWLQALDASTGKPRWKQQWPTPLVAGITSTEGGVLFTGDLNDNFLAIDEKTGKTLYSFNTGGSIGGGVISYEVGGKQYVATTSGVVSGFFGGNGPSAVVVFALP